MSNGGRSRGKGLAEAALVLIGALVVCQAAPGHDWTGDERGHKDDVFRGDAAARTERQLKGAGGSVDAKGSKSKLSHSNPLKSRPALLDTVDLSAEDGFLWQPTSMFDISCADTESDCDAILRYCLIHIGEYQANPWKYPMAVMLQKQSLCSKGDNTRSYRLSTLRAYLRDHPDEFLQPSGFIYHETRTGSTLVANMLAHVPSNLVVSENTLSEDPVRRCSACTHDQKLRLLRDVLPLLGSARAGHTRSFFKFQDSTTLPTMVEAFPHVSWVYLFRDPVEVMVSNLKGAYGKRNRFYEKDFDYEAADNGTVIDAINRPAAQRSRPMLSPCLLSATGGMKGKPREFVCALRLKALCDSAVSELMRGDERASAGWKGRGAVVEYTNLPRAVTEFIYPELFDVGWATLADHQPHFAKAATMYSKSMSNPESEFEMGTDAHYKHVMSEKAYKEAADSTGLSSLYQRMREMQTWQKQGI